MRVQAVFSEALQGTLRALIARELIICASKLPSDDSQRLTHSYARYQRE